MSRDAVFDDGADSDGCHGNPGRHVRINKEPALMRNTPLTVPVGSDEALYRLSGCRCIVHP